MVSVSVGFGDEEIRIRIPDGIDTHVVRGSTGAHGGDPLSVVARAVDEPLDAPPLEEVAQGARSVAIVVPDGTRPPAATVYLLPVLARLARAGLGPEKLSVVVARGIHAATPRAVVEDRLGTEVMALLRPVQSAPDTPGLNRTILDDEELGAVRVHQRVAEADLVVLTGIVLPHHLAGFGGGAKALVPGVAERDTVMAAHRLTLDALVRPDGSIRSAAGHLNGNAFHAATLRVARAFGRTWLLNVVLDAGGSIAAAASGEVGTAHAAAVDAYKEIHEVPEPEPFDLVIVGCPGTTGIDLVQAHKRLLVGLSWAKPGAPILWTPRARNGPGHPSLLPWFSAGKLPRHLAALRSDFHPYGLTAYSMRRIAKDHPVHVVSEMSRDLLRPMGFLPFEDAEAALSFALKEHDVETCAVLP